MKIDFVFLYRIADGTRAFNFIYHSKVINYI